jgi:hypothetical protein
MADEQTPPVSVGAPPPSRREGGDYEFDAQQNKTLEGLATALKALGLFFVVYGALTAVGAADQFQARAFLGGARTLVEGALYLVTSRFLRAGSRALEAVVDTRGQDIPNLLRGLDVVRKAIVFWGWAMFALLTIQFLYVGVSLAARHFGLQLPLR